MLNMRLEAPKELEANKRFRLKLIDAAAEDEELQQLIIKKCATGVEGFEFFSDALCWTFDPREENPHKPFILWPKQRQFAHFLEDMYIRSQLGEKINIAVDKPRAVGVTWEVMIWLFWHYLFHDFTARIGSRKEAYVDMRGEQDTLFAKIDYQLERIPSWLIGYHARPSMICKPGNTDNTNSISGESANPNFGRGGRKNVVMFDEFGFWDWAKSSWESSGETSNFRIAVSSPPETGPDSHHYKLLNKQAGRVYTFDFDWSDDPRRDQKWLEEARATKSDEEMAREIFKSYEGTTKGKVYAISLRHARLTNVTYDSRLPLFVSWDFGLDAVAMIWWQKDFAMNEVRMIDCYTNSDQDIGFYIPFVTGEIASGQYEYKEYELDLIEKHKMWSRTITHFGDPDVRKRNLINKESTKDFLRKRGIYVQSKPWGGRTWNDMKEKTMRLFRRMMVNEKACEPVLSAVRNAKYPERREGSQSVTEIAKPIHDWTSHFRTSMEYFADNEPESDQVITRVQSTSADAPAPKAPHEVEADVIAQEKRDLSQITQRIRTVLSTTQSGSSNPHRTL